MTTVNVIGLLVVAAAYHVGQRWHEARIAVWIAACVVVASVVAEWGMR